MGKRTILAGFCIFLALCLFAVGGVFIIKDITDKKDEATITSNTAAAEQTTLPTTVKPVNALPQTPEEQSAELSDLLDKSGYDFSTLENIRQLVVVTGGKGEYYLECYECEGGVWHSTGIRSKAFVGKNGTVDAEKKVEGDYFTPRGLYDLGFAFGTNKNPGTEMEYREVCEGIYWVDDPSSDYYNKWVDARSQEVNWASAEKLWTYDEYIYGSVIEYNTDPIVKNKGSAIFLHVGYKYTAGCVASDENTIVEILKWLKPDSNPAILIY